MSVRTTSPLNHWKNQKIKSKKRPILSNEFLFCSFQSSHKLAFFSPYVKLS